MTNMLKNTIKNIAFQIAAVALLVSAVLPQAASAAVNAEFSLTPSSSSVTTGQNTIVTLNLNTGGNSVNAWKATINYSTSAFSSVSVATAPGSPFTLVQKPDVASGGTIRISRYATTASSTSGAVATITLKANALGATSLSFAHICNPTSDATPCSAVTDASGTNLLSGLNNASITVTAVPVVPGTTTTKTTTKKKGVTGAVAAAVGAVTAITNPTAETQTTTTEQAENNAIVRIKVVNKNNKPVENATVTLGGQKATTNSAGEALFTELPTGRLNGTVTYNGKSQSFGIDVVAGSSFEKPQLATITFNAAAASALPKYLVLVLIIALAGVGVFLFLRKRDNEQTITLPSDPDLKPKKAEPEMIAAVKPIETKIKEEKPKKVLKPDKDEPKDKTIKRNDPLKPGVVVRPSDGL